MKLLSRLLAVFTLSAFAVQAVGLINFAYAASKTEAPPPSRSFQAAQDLARAAAEVQALLLRITEKAARGVNTSAELQQLQVKSQILQGLINQLRVQLDDTAQILQSLTQQGKISGDVVTSFETFRRDWWSAVSGGLTSLSSLQTPSDTPLAQRAETTLGALKALQLDQPLNITHTQTDPTKLPHRRADKHRRDHEAKPAIIPGQAPPGPADLAPTTDAQITPEIQALAAQLNLDPVKLFAFVRNTIEFQPYFGSLKGSQGTLLEKAGNDMDQASLLIALLRASNVPARYVAGVVELPIKKVMNWVGVETREAAVEAIASSGIPAQARTSAEGTITHLSFFHVWVEAFLPRERDNDRERQHDRESERDHDRDRHREPEHDRESEGHHDRERRAPHGARWVQLDPSFKQHHFTEGIDLTAATGFDVDTFLLGATSGATINEAQSFFTNLNEPFINQELTRLTDNLLAFVQAELGPTATVGDVLGTKQIKPLKRRELRELAESFPFKTFTPQQEFAKLPQGFRHFVNFAMFGFSHLFALPELAEKRVTVTYVAATPQDQALIDAFGGILNVFPAFLVNLKPQLKVEGQVVAEGEGVPLGSSQILRSAFRRPPETAFDINDKIVTTGADYAIALNLQRVSLDGVRARIDRFSSFLASLGPTPSLSSEIVEEALHLTGQAYFLEVDVQNEIVARTAKVVFTREPSEAFLSQDLSVLFFFGFPVLVSRGSVSIDVKRNIVNPISVVGDTRQEVSWLLTSGSFGSAAEHAIFEQLYGVPSVSTERLLTLANSQGVRIFTIDGTNIAQILPQLDTFAIVKENIVESINAGLVAIIPQRNLQFNDWLGMGWIVLDPATGSAGFLIAGSLTAGGSTGQPADVGLFNQKAMKELGAAKLLLGLAATATGGAVFAGTGAALISEALVGGGLILGLAGVFVLGVGIAMVAIAVAAAIFLVPKILAADSSRKRRWFAYQSILATSA